MQNALVSALQHAKNHTERPSNNTKHPRNYINNMLTASKNTLATT